MTRFFQKANDHQVDGSPAALESLLRQFRDGRLSGVFEIPAAAQEMQVVVLAGGTEAGRYRLGPAWQAKLAPAEIALAQGKGAIRTVALPDHASRAIWQALEGRTPVRQQVAGASGWMEFLERCRADRRTGMLELASGSCEGFLFLQEGQPAPGEAIFYSEEGFSTDPLVLEGCLGPDTDVLFYESDPATQAYQCTLLRMGAVRWGSRILSGYQEMVGQRLLGALNANLNTMFTHRQWDIRPVNTEIIDHHFFCESQAAVQAYRAMFGVITQLIVQVIGGMFTRRILNNTFEQLAVPERQAFQARSLTPDTLIR